MTKKGFVKCGAIGRVWKNPVTQEQMQKARECLGARLGKYFANRKIGMGHTDALHEARKP